MVSKLPEGPEWSYEIKLDGYRAQSLCEVSGTQLLSRKGKDLGKRFPAIGLVRGDFARLNATMLSSVAYETDAASSPHRL